MNKFVNQTDGEQNDVVVPMLSKNVTRKSLCLELDAEMELMRDQIIPLLSGKLKNGLTILFCELPHIVPRPGPEHLTEEMLQRPKNWFRRLGPRVRASGALFGIGCTRANFAPQGMFGQPSAAINFNFFIVCRRGFGDAVAQQLRKLRSPRRRKPHWPTTTATVTKITSPAELKAAVSKTFPSQYRVRLLQNQLPVANFEERRRVRNEVRRRVSDAITAVGPSRLTSMFGLARNGSKLVRLKPRKS